MLIDARIPVHFLDPDAGVPPGRADQVLILSDSASAARPKPEPGWMLVLRLPEPATRPSPGGHAPGCACCTGRSPSATSLTGLFQARARGEVGFFRALVAILPGQEAADLRDALVTDPFLSGCFVRAN